MNLAETSNATLDHMNSNGFMRNIQVLQNSGWMITTLTEVRNRVDLLVIVGTDIVSMFPRFFEREVWNRETLYGQDTGQREVVYLGGRNINTDAGIAPNGRKPEVLPCDLDRLPDVAAALRAIVSGEKVSGKKLHTKEVAGIAVADLEKLAQRMLAAKYSVVVWAAAALNFPHAELTVQNITELVKTLNKTTRAAGLPLGSIDGDMNANQVCTWISGYPMRTSYAHGYPEHDPYHFSADHLLASGEADALFWVSSFNPDRTPPAASMPTVIFGHAHMQLDKEPDVFIPIGTPGADHKGIMFRTDNVVSLPLQKLRNSTLPTLAEVLSSIEQTYREIAAC
jgi:formylmethanofuran dehydrogenase subunit B